MNWHTQHSRHFKAELTYTILKTFQGWTDIHNTQDIWRLNWQTQHSRHFKAELTDTALKNTPRTYHSGHVKTQRTRTLQGYTYHWRHVKIQRIHTHQGHTTERHARFRPRTVISETHPFLGGAGAGGFLPGPSPLGDAGGGRLAAQLQHHLARASRVMARAVVVAVAATVGVGVDHHEVIGHTGHRNRANEEGGNEERHRDDWPATHFSLFFCFLFSLFHKKQTTRTPLMTQTVVVVMVVVVVVVVVRGSMLSEKRAQCGLWRWWWWWWCWLRRRRSRQWWWLWLAVERGSSNQPHPLVSNKQTHLASTTHKVYTNTSTED